MLLIVTILESSLRVQFFLLFFIFDTRKRERGKLLITCILETLALLGNETHSQNPAF